MPRIGTARSDLAGSVKRWHAYALFWLIALCGFTAAGVRILYSRPVPYPILAGCVVAVVFFAGLYLAAADVLEHRAEEHERDVHRWMAENMDREGR